MTTTDREGIMKNLGIISYNIHCNFTNYGSALQSWALHQAITSLGGYVPKLIDYCPDILADKDPLNPYKNMWDQNEEARRMCELSMPAIKENYYKFDKFYTDRFFRTSKKYTSKNFDESVHDEDLSGFICGSDTIFCIDEFGFDDGFYANYHSMQGHSVAYAASFGDAAFSAEDYDTLNQRLQNFKAIGLREIAMVPYVQNHTDAVVQKVIDPTLLLPREKYDTIAVPERLEDEKYLLYYSRRYSPEMERYAEVLAAKNHWKVVDISLQAANAAKGHHMYYEAGVEEFLSLVKHAEYVVTNSFHGLIFAVQYRNPFVVFSRDQCNTKINEVLQLFGLSDHLLITGTEEVDDSIDYDAVHQRIAAAREASMSFLKMELELLLRT